MTDVLKPDLCVIGAGSAGLSVAAAAAGFGVSVVLVEKGRMGGDCLNTGCVPSKALIAAAERADAMRGAAAFGIAAQDPQVNFGRVHDHIRDVIAGIAPTDSAERFRGMGVTVLAEAGRFEDRRTLRAGETRVRARRFVIATGARPAVPDIPGLDSVSYHTNETIFDVTRKPAHLIVVGGGPVGLELAQAYRRLGAQVSVLEAAHLLPHEDPELADHVREALERDGVTVRTGTSITRVEPRKAGVRVVLGGEEEAVDGSHLLIAAGRRPTVEGLGLENAGVRYDGRGIGVDARLRTSNRRIYAVGDVTGGPQFTHVAGQHAGIVVRNVLFRLRARVGYAHVPRVTYTAPELAQVGMTEAEARRGHRRLRIMRWPFAENDRARTMRQTAGEIKLIATKKGRVLGVGIVGAQAGETIGLWGLAIRKGLKVADVADCVMPYPTLGEVSKRAAMEFYRPHLTSPWLRRIISFLRLFG